MSPGGIFSFTRDIATASSLRWLIHPYNNGYHLTHHLLPAVPYYNLARAHARCLDTPSFCKHALICDSYFGNERSVIRREPHVVLA